MMNDFNSGNNIVLITSNMAAMGLQFSNRVFTVFPHVADPRILILNITGDKFVLFRDEDELDPLRRLKIGPRRGTDVLVTAGSS
jgi:hypothetical protein